MKTILWMLAGIAIGILSWIPVNTADRYTIPFFEAILAIIGTVSGAIIVIVAAVKWIRHGNNPRPALHR